jgi:hypothetical protein
MRYYLSGPYAWRDKLAEYADELIWRGHEVTSNWLSSTIDDDFALDGDTKEHFASIDLIDINAAEVFIAFTADGRKYHRGGRHVEFGYALGIAAFRMMQTVVIGETDNIFYSVKDVRQFDDWHAFLATIDDLNQPKLF